MVFCMVFINFSSGLSFVKLLNGEGGFFFALDFCNRASNSSRYALRASNKEYYFLLCRNIFRPNKDKKTLPNGNSYNLIKNQRIKNPVKLYRDSRL